MWRERAGSFRPPPLPLWDVYYDVNDPNLTSPFLTLRQCQSQTRWQSYDRWQSQSALEVAGCNKPMGTYNFYLSDLFIDDSRSGQFLDLPIISQRGRITWLIFSQIIVVNCHIANFTIKDISHDYPGLSRCKFCYVTAMRSCDITKCHQNVFCSWFSIEKS